MWESSYGNYKNSVENVRTVWWIAFKEIKNYFSLTNVQPSLGHLQGNEVRNVGKRNIVVLVFHDVNLPNNFHVFIVRSQINLRVCRKRSKAFLILGKWWNLRERLCSQETLCNMFNVIKLSTLNNYWITIFLWKAQKHSINIWRGRLCHI